MDKHVVAAAWGCVFVFGCMQAIHFYTTVLVTVTSAPWCLKEGVFQTVMCSVCLHQGHEMARAGGRCLCGSGGLPNLDVAFLSLLQANTGFLRPCLRWRPIIYPAGKKEEG